MRKRAFDEVTICRRATEEALSALAEHFPGVDRDASWRASSDDLKARTPRRSGALFPLAS